MKKDLRFVLQVFFIQGGFFMLGKVICFILGAMVGGTFGVLGMCLFFISKDNDLREEHMS